ncbi:MAG TPA: hypothetical protein VGG57_23165 [Stellaceae bacterium]|jgi:hypothetical protein
MGPVAIAALAGCTPSGQPIVIDGANPIPLGSTNTGQNPAPPEIAYPVGVTPEDARNEIVGRYIRESDQLCGEYLQNLTRYQRTSNLIFGSLSTALGGLGAAFTQASVVRPLSAAASIASGERAEVEADAFAKQTAEVVAAAIKNSRLRTYNDIVQNKFPRPISAWPTGLAIADVVSYHNKCSLNEGLAEAAASVAATTTTVPHDSTNPADPVGRSGGPATPAALVNAAIGAGMAQQTGANAGVAALVAGSGPSVGGPTLPPSPVIVPQNVIPAPLPRVVLPPGTVILKGPIPTAVQARKTALLLFIRDSATSDQLTQIIDILKLPKPATEKAARSEIRQKIGSFVSDPATAAQQMDSLSQTLLPALPHPF